MNRQILALPITLFALVAAFVLMLYAGPKGNSSMDKATTVVGWNEAEKDWKAGKLERATFAAGCFWGVEATFRKLDGVVATRVGYTGGRTEKPTYKEVCTNNTGHAEAVDVLYDPKKTSYEKLLDVFFTSHDPTTRDRQGPDIGSQYRSAVFYHDVEQKKAAEAARDKHQESQRITRPIVTRIAEADTFWPAEDYHQQYFEKQGGGTCHF